MRTQVASSVLFWVCGLRVFPECLRYPRSARRLVQHLSGWANGHAWQRAFTIRWWGPIFGMSNASLSMTQPCR